MGIQAIEVPKLLRDIDVATYLEQGFLVIPDLLSHNQLATLQAEVTKICTGCYVLSGQVNLPPNLSDFEAICRVATVYSPHSVCVPILDLAKNPKICGIISQIAAAHRRNWDGSAKHVQCTLFVKPPGMHGHAWHQDDRAIPTWDQSLCAAWTPLDKTTTANGCLRVIPGSHRQGFLFPLRQHEQPQRYHFFNEAFGFDEGLAVPLELEPRSVLFFSGTLLHSSEPNHTNNCRRVIVNHYCNAWSELLFHDVEKNIVNDLRTIIPVSGVDPYEASGYLPLPEAYITYYDSAKC